MGQITRPCVVGSVAETFDAGAAGEWDEENVLEVILLTGHLSSASEAAVLAGSNRIAVQTDAGNWEIIGFCEAELVAPNRYALRKLWRGAGGTDWAIGAVSVGNAVMLLDERPLMLPLDAYRLGSKVAFKCYAGPTDLVGQEVTLELDTAPGLPLAPNALSAERQGNDDIVFAWQRRSRAVGDGWSGQNPPHEYGPEAYRVTVVYGGVVVRSLDVTAQSVTYTKAQQIADFSANATEFVWRVQQLSHSVGAGHVAEAEFDD